MCPTDPEVYSRGSPRRVADSCQHDQRLQFGDRYVLFGTVQYGLQTTGHGSINPGRTGFVGSSTATSSIVNSIKYSGYGVPGDAILSTAVLDFSGEFGAADIGSAVQNPPNSFAESPTFADSLGTFIVTISSALGGTATVNGRFGHFDLVPQFGADLVANNPISVLWTATATFSAVNPPIPGCSSCDEIFDVSDSRSFAASNTANRLTINYDLRPTVAETPEPSSYTLIGIGLGLGLLGGAVWSRRLKLGSPRL